MTRPQPAAPFSGSSWWHIGDGVALGLWATTVTYTIHFHEKWADEAQAWLIARDLDLRTIWLHELRYEGSPGLWHTILWVAQHIFHAKYGAISYLGAFFAFLGIVFLFFGTPFPRPIRWLMALGYFFLYQYAVVARSYVLFPLLSLIVARQYRNLRRPDLFAISLVPLATVTAHGSLMALALAIAYGLRFLKQWSDHDDKTRLRFELSAAGIAVLYALLFFILRPPGDVEATHQGGLTALVIAQRTLSSVVGALFDNTWLSLAAFVIFGLWCFQRRALTSYLLPVLSMAGLCGYAATGPYQFGTVYLGMITGLAIAWPTPEESRRSAPFGTWTGRTMLATLTAVLCYQIYAAGLAVRNDVRLPYSGAEDMARYLEPLVTEGKVIYGNQYGMVGINAYFDHNIFANLNRAYYHHSLSEFSPELLSAELQARKADYIVIQYFDPYDETTFRNYAGRMAGAGYPLVHFSDGYIVIKTGYSHSQNYMLFKKREP